MFSNTEKLARLFIYYIYAYNYYPLQNTYFIIYFNYNNCWFRKVQSVVRVKYCIYFMVFYIYDLYRTILLGNNVVTKKKKCYKINIIWMFENNEWFVFKNNHSARKWI